MGRLVKAKVKDKGKDKGKGKVRTRAHFNGSLRTCSIMTWLSCALTVWKSQGEGVRG